MLSLYDTTEAIPGVVVYRDHQNLGQFYYCSTTPRIAMNGRAPAISFVKFRRDITDNIDFDETQSLGGGILNFSVDLSLTEDELDDIRRAIPKSFKNVPDEISLAPISVRDGSVRLTAMRDAADTPGAAPEAPRGLKLFEEVHGSTKPSLVGTQRASFTVMLSREMATAIEQMLRGGAGLFSVFYQLKFLGMTPAMNVRVEADYKRIYSHLETELGVQAQVQAVSIAADVGAAFQRLREDEVIKVVITSFTDDDDLKAQGEAAWEWYKGQLTRDFFKTSMSPPSFMQPRSGGGMLGQLQSLFGAIPGPGATGGALLPTRGAPNPAPPTAGPPATGPSDQVATTAETNQAQSAMRSTGGGGAGNAASELSPFRIGFSLKMFHQDELKTRVFDYTLQSAIEAEANPNGPFASMCDGYNIDKLIFEVNMDDPFFDRIISTVTMGQDLASLGIASVAINMEYPANRPPGEDADHVDGFLFRPADTESHSFTTFLNDRRDRDYQYQMIITFDPLTEWRGRDSQIRTPWLPTAARQLPLAPFDAISRLDVEIGLSALTSEVIAQVEVDVEYDDPATGFRDARTFILVRGGPSHHWRLRLADDAKVIYRYRVRYIFKDSNLQIETPFETSEKPAIVVNPPFRGRQKVMVNPLLLDAANLLQAIVDVEYVEPDTGYTVSQRETYDGMMPLATREFIIPTLHADPLPVKYTTTIIKLDGQVITAEAETDAGIILLTEGAGVVQRVRVRLPPAGIGDRIAVKVDLTGTGDIPDQTTALFVPGALGDQMVSLVQPSAAARAFDFVVTGYDLSGNPTVIRQGRAQDQVFIVPLA